MANHKYPAPYDVEVLPPELRRYEEGSQRLINPLYVTTPGAPQPPLHLGPPLPVSISVDKPQDTQIKSYYKDMFGDDLSVVAQALDAPWANNDQRRLAARIFNGETSINSLSIEETKLVDDMATSYIEYGGEDEKVRQAPSKRLRVSDEDPDPGEEDDPDMQSEEGSVLRSELPTSITNAYGFTRKES